MTTDGPRQAVFKTAELLENILLHLPVMTIFGVQRVSRQFHDIVATSTAIRQKLFLKSSGERQQTWIAHSNEQVVDPFWALFAPSDVQFVRCSNGDSDKPNNQKKWTPARLNPLYDLRFLILLVGVLTLVDAYRLHVHRSFSGLTAAARTWHEQSETVQLMPAFNLHPRATSASWRDTFLTDPPTMFAECTLYVAIGKLVNSYGSKHFAVAGVNDEGLTIGSVIDAAMNHKGRACVRLPRSFEELEDATIGDVMTKLGETERKQAKCDHSSTLLYLNGMVIPIDEEWKSVKGI